MPNQPTKAQKSAQGFLNIAREYFQAAEELHASKSRISHALYFLYFHATELLLKSYLLAHNEKVGGHKISEHYKRCRKLGLKIEADDRIGLGNIVGLLESGNDEMAFRYFTKKSRVMPELDWTRRVVKQLRDTIAKTVEPNGLQPPGPVTGFNLIMGMPAPKR
jgi:hypothetical protein